MLFSPLHSKRARQIFIGLALVLVALGVGLRFYQIQQDQFVYYDEGLYLDHSRAFVELVERSRPEGLGGYFNALAFLFRLACASNKVLWYFLVGLRPFIIGEHSLYFSRVVSAVFGSLTLWVVFLFAQRQYDSRIAGLLAACLLAALPSHVFYSRLGLQETLSAFCFTLAAYFFCFGRKFIVKSLIAGLLFACVYFTNYRMIVLPFFMVFMEFYLAFAQARPVAYRKLVWSLLTFLACVVLIGDCYGGANAMNTFGWMFHQANLAQGHFSVINLLSYPYYVFHFEGILFGCLFFFSPIVILFVRKKGVSFRDRFYSLLPYMIVMLQIVLFSFPQEKGARYLCVVMPMMAVAVSGLVSLRFREISLVKQKRYVLVVLLMFIHFFYLDSLIMRIHSDYKTVMMHMKMIDPQAKVMSSQPLVQRLYVPIKQDVIEAPKNIEELMAHYAKGYRYLILCPQSYISYTADAKRFSPQLIGPYQFALTMLKPLKEYPHFDAYMFDRFVLEHNENLLRSLKFIHANKDGQLGHLRIYDVSHMVIAVNQFMESQGGH